MSRAWSLALLIAALGVGTGVACGSREKAATGTGRAAAAGAVPAVELTAGAVQAAGVGTTRVARVDLSHTVRAVGTIEADERKLVRVASRVNGRIDRLFLNFTGQPVVKGGA